MGKKHLTEAEFKLHKQLLEAGLSVSKVAKTLGRSYNVVSRINTNSSLDAYRKSVTSINGTRKEAPASQDKYGADLVAVLENISTKLSDMSTSLKWLEENCAVPHRKLFR